jgi:hypothetical protein
MEANPYYRLDGSDDIIINEKNKIYGFNESGTFSNNVNQNVTIYTPNTLESTVNYLVYVDSDKNNKFRLLGTTTTYINGGETKIAETNGVNILALQ